MSLATRCSSCGTVFRVVQDQLKVSEGWVRCGRCNQVFNALSGLFDLDRESPPEWEPPEPTVGEPVAAGPQSPSPDHEEAADVAAPPDPRLVDRIDAELLGVRNRAADTHDPVVEAVSAEGSDRLSTATDDGPVERSDDAGPESEPEFVRRAERAQRWERPWVRAALGVLAVALLVLLGLQAAHHFRDELAARQPDAVPVLAAWCEAAGCRLGPPRRIDDVAVESTALSKATAADAYKLSVVLRNHGATAVAMPAIDLALTDASGQLIARRTVMPRDFAAATDRLAAGGEATLQAVLTAGATKITGYTVEPFYP